MLNTKKHPLGDQLQALFQANDKVRAYLCAHEHLWNCSRLEKAPQVWQVIVGNAGSKLNSKWNPRGGSTSASRDARASEPVAWSNQNPNPLSFYDRSRTFVGFYPI